MKLQITPKFPARVLAGDGVSITTANGTYTISIAEYRSVAALAAAVVPILSGIARTQGYATPGDGGHAYYKVVPSEPAHPGKIHTVYGEWLELVADYPRASQFGVIADGEYVFSAVTITAGSPALRVNGAAFTTADVGKIIMVEGAGAAGAVLTTTILARIDATNITLTANAATPLAAAIKAVVYGRDNGAHLDNAIAFVKAIGGGVLKLPNGRIIRSGITALSSTVPIQIAGAGRRATILHTTSAAAMTLDAAGAESAYIFALRDFSIARTPYPSGSGSLAISITNAPGSLLERIAIGIQGETGSWDTGINLAAASPGCDFVDCHFVDVYGYGLRSVGGAEDFSSQVLRVIGGSFLRCGLVSNGGGLIIRNGTAVTVDGINAGDCYDAVTFQNCSGVSLIRSYIETSTHANLVFSADCINFIIEGNWLGASPATEFDHLFKTRFAYNVFYNYAVSFAANCLDIDWGPFDAALGGGLTGDTPWRPVTLINSWANVGGYQTAGYRMHGDGTLELRGVIGVGTAPSDAFVLADGFRPSGALVVAATGDNGAVGAVAIYPSGAVTPISMPGTNISLDGIRITIR